MGFDLIPIAPAPDAPRDCYGKEILSGRYTVTDWGWLIDKLKAWGVDVSEFSWRNDGEVISDATCKRVADAIKAHLPELDDDVCGWIAPHIKRWRTCGGYRQT